MLIHIMDDILRLQGLGLLEPLLADRTTGRNILWATDAYAEYGGRFARNAQISVGLITGDYAGLIRTRARKAFEQQSQRTKARAEVFTPLWVVAKMNDHLDEVWFQRKDGVHKTDEQGRIAFNTKKTWQQYVENRRLEITCGEGPFLVSRYDAATGEVIPLAVRVGLLDRKLRAVSENTETVGDWMHWAVKALRATYGYEFQGDSLVIARINVIMSVWEAFEARWGQAPTAAQLRKAVEAIAWNLWQMDGLTDRVPYAKENLQLSLFDLLPDAKPPLPPYCRIKNWRQQRTNQFRNLKGERTRMKFDFIIGNPPYQEERYSVIPTTNGQKPMTNIFHRFQLGADLVADKATVLIYPAGRWIHRSGKGQGFAKFGLDQINDHRLAKLIYYADAKEVFQGVSIADGISIVIKETRKTCPGFEYVYVKGSQIIKLKMDNPGETLIPLDPRDLIIANKISLFVSNYGLNYLHDAILPRTLFGIASDYVEKNPGVLRLYNDRDAVDFTKEIKILTNDKAGKAGRAKWFVGPRSVVSSNENLINEFQVVVSSANAGGQKRDNQLEIIDNHSAFGRARVALRSFATSEEAQHFYDYVRCYIIRYAFLMTDEALTSLGKSVPDLIDYSSNNRLIDYSQSIDSQLQQMLSLDENDMAYITERVDNIRRK